MTNQGDVQAAVRARSGNTDGLSYNEDWHALWDVEEVPAGMFNERMLTWINTELSASHTNVAEAMQAYAESLDFYNWSSMNTITPFDPLELFGEGDAGDLWVASAIEADADDPVAAWVGSHDETSLAQAVAGRQPTLRASGSSMWLEFDIDDMDEADVLGDCLFGEFAISTAELTIIVAAQNEDPAEGSSDDNNRRTVCLKVPQAAAAERDINIFHNLPRVATESGVFGGAGMRHPENAAVNLTASANAGLGIPGVTSYQRDGTAVQDAWIDRSPLTRVTTTTTTFTTTHLGVGYGLGTSLDFNTTGAGHWIGRIYGVFVIDRVLSAGERAQVESYMRGLMSA